MVKFIDYARYFMSTMDIPMCRFQAEGGEHLNYQHSRHYFQHTTRHGGQFRIDPNLTLLSTMYRKLSFEISSDATVAAEFNQFVNSHQAACTLQAAFRGQRTRNYFVREGSRHKEALLWQTKIL
jgi:hypothetical protein